MRADGVIIHLALDHRPACGAEPPAATTTLRDEVSCPPCVELLGPVPRWCPECRQIIPPRL